MRRAARHRLRGSGLACVAVLLLGLACDSGVGRAGLALDDGTFGSSDCGVCVDYACAAPIAACTSDPECGARLACLRACPVGADGDLDPGCAATCPAGASSVGLQRIADLDACRNDGLGFNCTACGAKAVAAIDAQMCPAAPQSNACYQCEDESCCEVESACHVDPACEAYRRCLIDCQALPGSSYGCNEKCLAEVPDGVAKFEPLNECLVTRCLVVCSTTPPSACAACPFTSCAEERLRLDVDPVGYVLDACVTAAVTPDDTAACLAAYPAAVPLLEAFTSCTMLKCPC